jgi:ketosteroid isomerase-like protein
MMFKSRIAVVAVFLVIVSASASAQTAMSADEKAIRDAIARFDRGETRGLYAADRVFWSGAYRKPTVGADPGEEIPSANQPSARVPNSQRNQTTPVRIEIAKSGDLAWEFSDGVISFDMKDGRKVSFPQGILRVWRKEGADWKIAAIFTRPHDQTAPAPSTPGR